MRHLSVRHLRREELPKAYTLVQAAAPSVTFDCWRTHARALTQEDPKEGAERPQGLLGAEDARGFLAGIASYQIRSSLQHGRVLVAADFIALDLIRREEVAQALTRGLEQEAARHDCQAIQFSLAYGPAGASSQWLSEFLTINGHSLEGPQYCKPLPQAR